MGLAVSLSIVLQRIITMHHLVNKSNFLVNDVILVKWVWRIDFFWSNNVFVTMVMEVHKTFFLSFHAGVLVMMWCVSAQFVSHKLLITRAPSLKDYQNVSKSSLCIFCKFSISFPSIRAEKKDRWRQWKQWSRLYTININHIEYFQRGKLGFIHTLAAINNKNNSIKIIGRA